MNVLCGLKKIVWQLIYAPYYRVRYWMYSALRDKYTILDSDKTVSYILEHKCSLSRFGDGEFAMVYHYLQNGQTEQFWIKSFQDYDRELARRLVSILRTEERLNHRIAIPYAIKSTKEYKGIERTFHERFVVLDIERFPAFLPISRLYLNAGFTRFYMNHRKIDFIKYISNLKKIWDKQNVIFIEGEHSRLGIGNDLFDNAQSVKRIICPSVNAFSCYEKIIEVVKKQDKNNLFLLALGHTATVLSFDMANMGFWAIDVGHIDVEYEWYLLGATEKVAIRNKYVNEVKEGRISTDLLDHLYLSQILTKIS